MKVLKVGKHTFVRHWMRWYVVEGNPVTSLPVILVPLAIKEEQITKKEKNK